MSLQVPLYVCVVVKCKRKERKSSETKRQIKGRREMRSQCSTTYPDWATWLWRARNETLLSMASRDLALSRTTCRYNTVAWHWEEKKTSLDANHANQTKTKFTEQNLRSHSTWNYLLDVRPLFELRFPWKEIHPVVKILPPTILYVNFPHRLWQNKYVYVYNIHLDPSLVNLLSELIHGSVARGTHQYLLVPAAEWGSHCNLGYQNSIWPM